MRRQSTWQHIAKLSVTVLTFFVLRPGTLWSDERSPDWSSECKACIERTKKVRQCYVQGIYSYFNNAQLRRDSFSNWKAELGPTAVPYPLDANRVLSFAWFCDGIKWRVDTRREYPLLGNDFSQTSYDGERYYTYDEYKSIGAITSDSSISRYLHLPVQSSGDLQSFAEDSIFGGNIMGYLKKIWIGDKSVPVFDRQDVIDEIPCELFRFNSSSTDSDTDVQIWTSRDKGLVLKIVAKTERHGSHDGAMHVYLARDVREVDAVYMPFQVKTEVYVITNNTPRWMCTRLIQCDQIQVNDRNSVSAFQHPIRISSVVANQLDDPGRLKPIGGDPTEEVLRVRHGMPPHLEVTGVESNGVADDVADAQASRERK